MGGHVPPEVGRMVAEGLRGTWRTIESAPKDGTHVLLVGRSGRRYVVAWWGDYNAPDQGEPNYEPLYGWLGEGDCKNGPVWLRLQTYVEPTHWMPLPEPPQ